jgi:hypothetical protein
MAGGIFVYNGQVAGGLLPSAILPHPKTGAIGASSSYRCSISAEAILLERDIGLEVAFGNLMTAVSLRCQRYGSGVHPGGRSNSHGSTSRALASISTSVSLAEPALPSLPGLRRSGLRYRLFVVWPTPHFFGQRHLLQALFLHVESQVVGKDLVEGAFRHRASLQNFASKVLLENLAINC